MSVRNFQIFKPTSYPERSVLIQPGIITKAWLIEEGIVRQYDVLPNGSQITLNIYKPGAVLSLSWVLHDQPNRYFFVAETDVKARKIPIETYRTYLKTSNEVSFQLLTRLSSGFDGLFDRIVSQGQGDAKSRVLTELKIHLARFGQIDENGPYLTISVKDLATRTGLARETVSRMLAQLNRKGTISRTGTCIRIS